MTFITKLNAGTVVDRAGLNKLKTDEMATTLAELYSTPNANVIIVDDVRQFFSLRNLIAAMNDNLPILPLLLEQQGLTLTVDDLDIVQQFMEIKQVVLDEISANVPPLPPYPLAEVPAGWTVDDNIIFLAKHIRRKGGDHDHKATPLALQRVWKRAAAYWAGGAMPSTIYATFNGYSDCRVVVLADRVEIGCQTIKRFELEQLALHLGWDFPEAIVED